MARRTCGAATSAVGSEAAESLRTALCLREKSEKRLRRGGCTGGVEERRRVTGESCAGGGAGGGRSSGGGGRRRGVHCAVLPLPRLAAAQNTRTRPLGATNQPNLFSRAGCAGPVAA